MGSGLKGQVTIEFLLTTLAGLIIAGGAAYFAVQVFFGAQHLVPTSCLFVTGVGCTYMAIVSNSTATGFFLLGTNAQQYPVQAPTLLAKFSGITTNVNCIPNLIPPGGDFVCQTQLNNYLGRESTIIGNLTFNIFNCGLSGSACATPVPQSFVGTFVTNRSRVPTLHTYLKLGKPYYDSSNTLSINASLDLFGISTYFLSTIKVVPQNGAPPNINWDSPGGSLLNVSGVTLAKNCFVVLQVNYSNATAYNPIPLNTINYTNSTFHGASEGNYNCIFLSPNTTKVQLTGEENVVGAFLNPKIPVTVKVSGEENYLALANFNGTVDLSKGNNNNVTIYNGNIASMNIGGNKNLVTVVNATIWSLTIGGNNNLLRIRNTTIAKSTISGTNNMVQNF